MEMRTLGKSGIKVSAVGLGLMSMSGTYGNANDDESIRVIHYALDKGINFLDSSDMYGWGHNEELLGKALKGRRSGVIVATKFGQTKLPDGKQGVDGSPDYVLRACDASLKRLGIDVIDLYYQHRVDPNVPIEDTVGAMKRLVEAGKVRALGLSEVGVPELERASAIHPVASVQSELSLWTRDPLAEVLPWCQAHDVAFIPFSPLGRGFLTGTVSPASIAGDDFRAGMPRFAEQALQANLAIVERVRAVAARHGATPAQAALAWLLHRGEQVIPIPGTKKLRYLEENAAAADLDLTAEDVAELDELPAPVGGRY
jgi:aryl-alcohol dehydrogenase-like predicted oxidoreductase